ncbi:unnamed protein product [Prorocentrum cordatum]|uniref:DNA/RNA-binding protein Alba-like domain-containing protein n=1 Tax=Prorocentrum cordatum TaxID=2364126 RepID=A0ABN9VVL4_9DINO|nr:unnamed protein product [Polarella glacialis]
MDKYRKVDKPKSAEVAAEDEIRVTAAGSVSAYVSRAAKVFNELEKPKVVIRATGGALTKAVTLTEVIKRRFKGLHQITNLGSVEIEDEYEPLEEGLEMVTDTRTVAVLDITLSKEALDSSDKGYQPPIDEALVTDFDPEQVGKGRGRGKGRGKGKGKGEKGKGKGKGKEESASKGKGKGKGKDKGKDASEPKGKGKGKDKGKDSSEPKGKGKDKGKAKGKDESSKGKGKSTYESGKSKSKGYGKYDSYGYDSYDSYGYGKSSSKGQDGEELRLRRLRLVQQLGGIKLRRRVRWWRLWLERKQLRLRLQGRRLRRQLWQVWQLRLQGRRLRRQLWQIQWQGQEQVQWLRLRLQLLSTQCSRISAHTAGWSPRHPTM